MTQNFGRASALRNEKSKPERAKPTNSVSAAAACKQKFPRTKFGESNSTFTELRRSMMPIGRICKSQWVCYGYFF